MKKDIGKNISGPDYEDYTDDLSFLKQLEIPLLIRVLKEQASREHPMSARRISDELSALSGLEHSEKTVLRKLQRLLKLQAAIDDTALEKNLCLALGGVLKEVSGKNRDSLRAQSRYYFEPLLDRSDVDMICGTITSNRYLTQKEKDYLIARQQTLAYGDRFANDDRPLPERPSRKRDGASKVLEIVNRLHEAIHRQLQIEVIYGAYGASDKKPGTVELKPKNLKKPYRLNPYALLWNDGEYYLLATHSGHTNPSHFRVDRVLSADYVRQPDDATKLAAREKIPESLAPFFKRGKGGYEFLDEKYTTTYPLMAIYGEKDLCRCIIECRADAIGVVVDYFGTEIQILPPQLPHDAQEKDIGGRPPSYVGIRLPYAQFDNVRAFCLLQQEIVSAVAPERLVREVGGRLAEDADQYCGREIKNSSK